MVESASLAEICVRTVDGKEARLGDYPSVDLVLTELRKL